MRHGPARAHDLERIPGPLPSGRHGLPRELVLHSQRMRLLEAAIEIAGTDSYAAMTVTAVIGRAGVSRKTFYELFQDREACFLAAYELVVQQGLAGMRSRVAHVEPWPDRVRTVLAWTLSALARHPGEASVALVEVLGAGPRALERRDGVLGEVAALLDPGDAVRRRAGLPDLLPEAVAGALFEVLHARVRDGRAGELPTLLPQLHLCVLAPFLGPAEAAKAARPPQRPKA